MKKVAFIILSLASMNSLAQTYNEILGTRTGPAITSGDFNVIIGDAAGSTIDSESKNVILGFRACVGQLSIDGNPADPGDYGNFEETVEDCDPTDSVFIGYHAGIEATGGTDGVIIGAEAGTQNRGTDNTFVGSRAGFDNTSGFDNTFIGEEAGFSNTEGLQNVFIGEDTGYNNIDGDNNTAIGTKALFSNEIGRNNTAIGHDAGYEIGRNGRNANRNTVVGQSAGYEINAGVANTCIGDNACAFTQFTDFNTFIGVNAGFDNNRSNTDNVNESQRNTGMGIYAGYSNRTGSDNVWIGAFTDSGRYLPIYDHEPEVSNLSTNSTWPSPRNLSSQGNDTSIFRTTVLGSFASAGENDSVAIGYNSRADQVNSIAIGVNTLATFTNSITIGNNASAKGNNSIVIGNDNHTVMTANADSTTALGSAAYRYTDVVTNQVSVNAITGTAARIELAADSGTANDDVWALNAADGGDFSIASFATGTDVNVFSINNNGDATLSGDLTLNSDRRLKTNIQKIDDALALISEINGATYHWKDSQRGNELHYGLIAQEVEASMPELVGEDNQGMKTLNYQGLVPVLISAVNQSQHEKKQLEDRVLSLEEKLEKQSQLIQELMDRME